MVVYNVSVVVELAIAVAVCMVVIYVANFTLLLIFMDVVLVAMPLFATKCIE